MLLFVTCVVSSDLALELIELHQDAEGPNKGSTASTERFGELCFM